MAQFAAMRIIPLLFSLTLASLFTPMAGAAEPPSDIVVTGELGLEGQVQSIDKQSGEITLLANAFSTAAGRKEIEPPKPKTLVTTGITRFFDERTRRDFELTDLSIGRNVRVVGRDTGTGKPLLARLLIWRSTPPLEPSDPDTPPLIDGLLPASQAAYGVKVRVFDAGFESEKKLFPWGRETKPTFFLGFRISKPATAGEERPWWEWARFTGLSTPDGQTLFSSGAGDFGKNERGRGLTFANIDPRWKNVVANWEVTAPDAPVGAAGEFASFYEIKGEAPSPQKPRTEPKTVLQTAQGTIYILESITCDFEKKTTTFSISIEKPAEITDARVSTYPSQISDDKGTRFISQSRGESNRLTIRCNQLPAPDAKNIVIGLKVEESAATWKQLDYYQPIRMEIPVAALVKAKPPTLNVAGKPTVYHASNDVFDARLDEAQRSEIRWWGTLWVKPHETPETVKTLVQNVAEITGGKAIAADGREFDIETSETEETFFHNDGRAPTPDEQSFAIKINIDGDVPDAPVRLQLDTAQTKQFSHTLDLPRLAIPKTEVPVTLPPALAKGTIQLQKVALVRGQSADDIAQRTDGGAKAPNSGALVLVFALDRALPDATLVLKNLRLNDAGDISRSRTTPTWNGDALTGTKDDKLWTLILPWPEGKTRPLKMHLELLESGASEPAPPILIKGIIKGIDLKPDATTQ